MQLAYHAAASVGSIGSDTVGKAVMRGKLRT